MWDWAYAWQILPDLLAAAVITIEATLLGFAVAAVLGLAFAILRMSKNPWIANPVAALIEFVRGTPVLIQIFFMFYVLPQFGITMPALLTGVLALGLLMAYREKRPDRSDLVSLLVVAGGVVIGFPLLTALALRHVTSAHSIVFIGLLPLSTAIFAVVLGGERPRPAFWAFSGLGSALVAGFALSHDLAASAAGDALMLAAIVVCGLGYAEGARLSRTLGGWQVISWALVLSLPVMAGLALVHMPASFSGIGMPAWIGLAYVSVFSMLVGFVFWYRGLAQGGIAAVGQLQLLQPFLGLAIASALLGEPVTAAMLAATAGVIVCVAGARKFA